MTVTSSKPVVPIAASPAQQKLRGYLRKLGQPILPLIILGALGVGLAGAIQWRKAASEVALEATPLPVAVVRAVAAPHYTITRTFTGRIVPRRDSAVGFELSGHITRLLADDGDHVKQGQVIARLDTEQLQIQTLRLRAQLRENDARLALAELRLKRQRRLKTSGHTSQDAIDEIRFETQALKAQQDSLNASLAAIRTDIKDTALRAPFDAVVVQRFADEGRVVSAGASIFQLHESGHSEARIGVPLNYATQLQRGDRHTLELNGSMVTATVTALIPAVDAGTRTVTVVFSLNPPSMTKLAMANELVRFKLKDTVAATGYWLPTTALSEGRRGLWTVLVAVPQNPSATMLHHHHIVRKSVEVLHAETNHVFVRGTLMEDDLIVTKGVHRLVPGQFVRIIQGQRSSTAYTE